MSVKSSKRTDKRSLSERNTLKVPLSLYRSRS